MAPSESVPSATVTDLDTARRTRARGTESEKGGARKPANRRFDAEKVERLKAEIADGRYRIDAESVADRFIEHERNN